MASIPESWQASDGRVVSPAPRSQLITLVRKNAGYLAILWGISLLAYVPIWTDVLFTNDTIPNVFVTRYPSFKTFYEGRWLADIIIQLAGGSGAQALQFILAAAVQAINALILCRIFRCDRPTSLLVIGCVLVLHPAFLDYYSFTIDATTFALGDTFALLGVLALERVAGRRGVALAVCAFVAAIASYQPKIALCATLVLCWVTYRAAGRDDRLAPLLATCQRAAAAFGLAVIAYYLSTKLTIFASGGGRQHLNDLPAIAHQILYAFPKLLRDFTTGADYLPRVLQFLPAACGSAAAIIILIRAGKRGPASLAVAVLALVAIIAATRLCYIINDQAWEDFGRITFPHAYLVAGALIVLARTSYARRVGTVAGAILAWSFFVLASQEANAALMKSLFDEQKINRVIARVEAVTPDLYARQHALVIIGDLNFAARRALVRFGNSAYKSQLGTEAFIFYRQTDIVNFLVGADAFTRPTGAQLTQAVAEARQHPAWPAGGSVWRSGDAVVVLLQPYTPQRATTWIQGQGDEANARFRTK